MLKDQYFNNPHFRRVRQGMKQYIYIYIFMVNQYIYGKAMICRATTDQPRLCNKIGIMWRGRS